MGHHYEKSADILAHEGDCYEKFQGAVVPPIYQNSLFVQPTTANGIPEHAYAYTRCTNPTLEVVEQKLAALEGGEDAVTFSSGMAAIAAAMMHFIRKDCHVIALKSLYGGSRALLKNYFPERYGVKTTFLGKEEINDLEKYITDETKLIYLESPSTCVFNLQDLEKIAKIAKAHGIGTVIDNTYATPLYQHPLEWGIDISVHTASKYLGGHSDIVAGACIASKEICQSLRDNERMLIGACMDPHQAWLLLRGMRTLKVRLEQHQRNGLKVAEYLKNHPYIKKVYYLGLRDSDQLDLQDKYIKGFNGLMSIVYDGTPEQANKFMDSLECVLKGCSWGGFESLAVSFTVGADEATCDELECDPNTIRLHIGLEDADTIIADLEQALQKSKEA